MNPHQKNKVDISSLTPEEQRLFRLYGKLPNKKDLLQNKLKERKYFDSGDYALSKAGKASDVGVTQIGREHPNPESIPHLSSSPHDLNGNGPGQHRGSISGGPTLPVPGNSQSGASGSPVKEGSYLARETSADDIPDGEDAPDKDTPDKDEKLESASPPSQRGAVPIRGMGK